MKTKNFTIHLNGQSALPLTEYFQKQKNTKVTSAIELDRAWTWQKSLMVFLVSALAGAATTIAVLQLVPEATKFDFSSMGDCAKKEGEAKTKCEKEEKDKKEAEKSPGPKEREKQIKEEPKKEIEAKKDSDSKDFDFSDIKSTCENESLARCTSRFNSALSKSKNKISLADARDFFDENVKPKIDESLNKIADDGYQKTDILKLRNNLQDAARATPSRYRDLWPSEVKNFIGNVREKINEDLLSKYLDTRNPVTKAENESILREFGMLPSSTFGEIFGGASGQTFAEAKLRCMTQFAGAADAETKCNQLAQIMTGYNSSLSDLLKKKGLSNQWNLFDENNPGDTLVRLEYEKKISELQARIDELSKKQTNTDGTTSTTTQTSAGTDTIQTGSSIPTDLIEQRRNSSGRVSSLPVTPNQSGIPTSLSGRGSNNSGTVQATGRFAAPVTAPGFTTGNTGSFAPVSTGRH